MDLIILFAAGVLLGRGTRPPGRRPEPAGREALALALLADGVCPRCLSQLGRGGSCGPCGLRYIPA